jgi:hypothetical protein
MALLSQGQVDRMRATAEQAFPDEVKILPLDARTDDGGGGYSETWADPDDVDATPARVGLPLGGETDERSVSRVRLADELLYTVWVAADTPVSQLDRCQWEDRMFEVVSVLERGNWEITRRFRIKEL